MKKRSAEILYRLAEAPGHRLRLAALLDDYSISEKTLRGDIASIIAFAQSPTGGSLIEADDRYVQLGYGTKPAEVIELLDSMDLYEYRLSSDERRTFIAFKLLELPQGTWLSAQALAEEMYVTRNTVIADCKLVAAWLEQYGIELLSKSKHGMRARFTAEQRWSLITDEFASLFMQRRCKNDFFMGMLGQMLALPFAPYDVLVNIRAYLRANNILITKDTESEIAACLVTALGCGMPSIESGQLGISEDGAATPFDAIGGLVVSVAQGLALLKLSDSEVAAIERAILGRNLRPQIKRFDDFDLYCAISHFLLLVGRDLAIDIQNDNLLVESLLSHIKSVTDWNADAFDVSIDGPSGMMVGMVQAAAEQHFQVLVDYLHRDLDQSMRSSIVIHICAALYRRESSARTCNVVVSCPGSIATSVYLEAQVKNYFNLNVVAALSPREIKQGALNGREIDFIISTVPIDNSPIPVVVVSPVLSVEDINHIQALAFRRSKINHAILKTGSSIMSRLRDLYAQGNERKAAYLNCQLDRILSELDQIEEQTLSTSPLLRMLERRFVMVATGYYTWREAIELVAQPLMEEGYFSHAYVERAINNVEEYGNYIIVNRGIALAHAAKSNDVCRDGLGLLVSPQGIEFDGGDRVHLLFFFSQISGDDYLELFREIIALGNDGAGLDRMIQVSSADEAYQVLVELLSDYSSTN